MKVSFTEASNPAKCFMLRVLSGVCGCFTTDHVYNQFEAQHLNT
jgi:hypothetical protein